MNLRQKRMLLGCMITCLIWACTLTGYNLTRRRIARPREAEWRSAILTSVDSNGIANTGPDLSGRAQAVAIREFLLEHANIYEPRLDFGLSYALAEEPVPDWTTVEEIFANAALKVVRSLAHDPSMRDFQDAGMRVNQDSYRSTGFPKPILFTDIESRGTRDVILGFTSAGDGVCVLLRKAEAAWEAIPLSMGDRLIGLWETHLGREKRPAVVMLFATGSDYKLRQRMVIWIWRNNRLERALTLPMPVNNSWQIEIRSHAIKPVVMKALVQSWQSPSWPPAKLVVHWNGRAFDEAGKPGAEAVDDRPLLDQARSLIASCNYSAAVSRINDVLRNPGQQSAGSEESRSAYYLKSICEAILGDFDSFRRDINAANSQSTLAVRTNGYRSEEDNACTSYYAEATSPDKLADKLVSDGKAMALVRSMAARVSGKPDEIVKAAHLKLEQMRTMHISTKGDPDYLTEVSWKGGSAVLDWRLSPSGHGWSTRLLAYGENARLSGDATSRRSRSEDDALFDSSSASDSALQVIPAPASVHLSSITEGRVNRLEIQYQNSSGWAVGNLAYSGDDFIDELTPHRRSVQDIEEGVGLAEERIFAAHDYASALEELRDLEAECEDLRIDHEDQRNWMDEIGYCQAICLRRLGDGRGAENVLTALQSLENRSKWRALAGLWLK